MPAHKHAHLMMQYAEDALTTDKPWELWEFCLEGKSKEDWIDCFDDPNWSPNCKYRRKPRTININGHEVPEPMRVAPEIGVTYWVADPVHERKSCEFCWDSNTHAPKWLRLGLCHSTREAAEAHARALLSFTEVK